MINDIYLKLLNSFGPQGWWPVTKEGELIPKYYQSNDITERQKLEICFGAILTQNTNWKNVEKAIINLNENNLIDIEKIIKIKGEKLAEIIKSSGYHNQKAKKLKNFCEFLLRNYSHSQKFSGKTFVRSYIHSPTKSATCERVRSELAHSHLRDFVGSVYKGKLDLLFKNDIDELRKQLLSINGVGDETADSIILYAAKKPIFVIDAYTKMVLNRIGYKEKTYEELQKLFMSNLPNSEKLFNEYHALLVELGKSICKKEPLCYKCPINNYCNYYKNFTVTCE